MPRPKLYHTKAQRYEANRNKAKKFYDKNRTKILETKKSTRTARLEELRQEELLAQRKQDKRERRKRAKTAVSPPHPSETESIEMNQQALRSSLDLLKKRFDRRFERTPAPTFFEQLYDKTIKWSFMTAKNEFLRTQILSPLVIARRPFQAFLKEVRTLDQKCLALYLEHGLGPDATTLRFHEVLREIETADSMVEEMEILWRENLLARQHQLHELIYQTHYRC
ncbi:hypothetical protein V5O48_009409 [Marasmius crinis-equi]|uniref:Uncharacterized protein n=1 Tax=Marasmius crinis-equi TaxID=585013 RepID=A0ABR3FB75_9AGAR